MITSTANRRVKWVRALQNKRQAREKERAFVLEGKRLAYEAVAAESPIHLVLHTDHLDERGRGLVNSMARLGAETAVVSDAVMAACSSTESPQGILLVLPIPSLPLPKSLTLALIIDRLADPGNLGTILRTALAAGVEAAFLAEGTVDPFNPKVVRGAMGAHFYLPMATIQIVDLPEQLTGLDMWITDAVGGVPYYNVDWRPPITLVVGAEAQGIQPTLREKAIGQVHIPMSGKTESLNAAIATAVILFEISRQRGER
ncbi:MAG: RNA methyltransferase [Anaerolineales bacterium]|nr:RNA methyltransferase [Anaerolineales bacterium]